MTHPKTQAPNRRFRLLSWPWLCGLLGLAFVRAALAADPLYENDSYLNYTVPTQILPVIDATNFLNNNWFEVNFTASQGFLGPNAETYETEDTVNYTNNGTMVANSSVLLNGFGLELNLSPGCGFNFDTYNTQSGLEQMAGNFYNAGSVRANSQVDLGINFIEASTVGKCLVNATNIVNPGTIELGDNSLIQLTGQNVDLTRGVLNVEGVLGIASLDYGVGTDTNGDWDPSANLQPTFAISSEFNSVQFPKPGFDEILVFPSTPYYEVNSVGTNYTLTRAVFISPNADPNANVTESVFFGGNPNPYLGQGAVTIQWAGAYIDATTGRQTTNYLYLNDFYLRGANTNNPILAPGIPSNFTFTQLATPALFSAAPATPNFPTIPPGVETNRYSYVDAQFIATTTPTNNPSPLNVTNYLSQAMPGRIQISAASNLDLSLAQISGQNYMSLRAPNQFNGSTGAQIFSPYSDINLGVTNGFLNITNLMEPYVPVWNGTCQAWSSDWFNLVSNTVVVFSNAIPVTTNTFVVTNEFRVILVNSDLTPTSPSEVQDLRFHATNSLVISDVFNILRSLYIDAQNLTLTTNRSNPVTPEGELNLQLVPTTPTSPVNYAFVWANAFPNLHNLTNNGAIRMPNANPVNIGSSATPYGAIVNHGIISDYGVNIYAANFESDDWFSNSVSGSFLLHSQTATLTNGLLYAGGDVSITSGSLVASNLTLQASRSLTLAVTNRLTDDGVTNGNVWTVGSAANSSPPGVYLQNGFNLPVKPATGDLLGTTATSIAPSGKLINNLWAGHDRGASNAGYTNNAAIGHLILNALNVAPGAQFYFGGTGASNAIYVDRLELAGYASYIYHDSGGNLPALAFNTNLVIYYADCVDASYGDVSLQLNHKNNDHLRWVPTYAGYFSSTNLVYLGTTNTFNVALATSTVIDSNGNGLANAFDPLPFFLPVMVNQTGSSRLLHLSLSVGTPFRWRPISSFTRRICSDLDSFTNIASQFVSPMPYPGPVANISTNYLMVAPPRYYRVMVYPWLTYPY